MVGELLIIKGLDEVLYELICSGLVAIKLGLIAMMLVLPLAVSEKLRPSRAAENCVNTRLRPVAPLH